MRRTGKPGTGSQGGLGRHHSTGWSATVLADSGISDVDTSELGDGAHGYVVDRPMTSACDAGSVGACICV